MKDNLINETINSDKEWFDDVLPSIEQLADDLEAQASQDRRGNSRKVIRAKASVTSESPDGNLPKPLSCTCRDISDSGCRLIVSKTLIPGERYTLHVQNQPAFEQSTFEQPVLVRCMRSQFLREDTFECGVMFFSPIEIQDNDAFDF